MEMNELQHTFKLRFKKESKNSLVFEVLNISWKRGDFFLGKKDLDVNDNAEIIRRAEQSLQGCYDRVILV